MIYRILHGRGRLAQLILPLLLGLSPAGHADDEAGLIRIRDLHFGETLYHFYQKKYFSAISDLLIAQQKYPIKTQGQEPDLLLGALYLSYNMSNQASGIFTRLAKQQTDKRIQSSAWYYLSRIAYQANKLQLAQQDAAKVGRYLPYRYNDEFQNLRGNILLKQKKYKQAVKVLQNFSGSSEWSNYAKFNLAIALIKSDEYDQGIDLLEEVADIDAQDIEQTALRDKANLALGYAALRAKQNDKAAAYFKQIRLVGSQSNKALLGIGWAFHKEGRLKRSLVSWVELKNRNSKDPAVQEAMLTIPYALEGLNAREQALAYYNDAINSYNTELASISQVIRSVKAGEFVSALRTLHLHQLDENHLHYTTLPDSIATPYLQGLIAEQGFQSVLKTYRDLLYMKNILAHWDQQMPAYRLMLKERKKAYQARIPQIKAFLNNSQESALLARYQKLKEQFSKADQQPLMLANEQELSLLHRLDKIKRILAKVPASDLDQQRDQYRLFSGLLQWQIETDYAPRHWQIEKELKTIEKVFAKLDKAKKSSLQTLVKTPQYFATFAKRIDDKQAAIRHLNQRISEAIAAQENLINRLAIDELEHQKHQLENYHIRASYSLTRLYDSLAALEKKP